MNAKAAFRGSSKLVYKFSTSVALAISLLGLPTAHSQYISRHKPFQQPSVGCGDFNYESIAIGPLDYRITPQDVKDLVERRHFTADIERLYRGGAGTVGGDLTYTLRAFPNHPRALKSAAELTRRNGWQKPQDLQFSINCWFDRAIAFRPDDVQVRILWAFELLKMKQTVAALEQTTIAETLAEGNPAVHYNVGLLYFELGDYEKSLANAKIAYDGGFNLPGLKDKLSKARQWRE